MLHPSLVTLLGAHRRAARAIVLATVLVVSLVAWAAPAFAAPPTFADFKVSVWPEFDDPRVLAIYESDLNSSVQLPYRFSTTVPVNAQVGMTCQLTPTGQHQ